MQNFGLWDWAIILAIVLVLFGGKRLPELAKSLGKSIAEFKKGMKQGEEENKTLQ
jgi:sec-independent protein translocase protein TatA